jgi:DNA invertase Pin-like site-specific DNA recombinase
MKVAIYSRVSTNEDKQNLDVQINPCMNRCQREGWSFEVFKEYASGSKESRPELDRMLQRIRAKEFNIVMVLRLDRLGRSLKHLLQLVEEFRNKDVKFVSLNESFDTTTAQGELFFNIVGAFAQFERRLIQERVKEGLDEAKRNNKVLGRPKGSKDGKLRKKGGYYLRYMKQKNT